MYSWILLNKENVKSFHLMLTLMFWGRHCEIVRITYWESWQFLQSDQWRNPRTCHCPPASLWTPCACCRAGTENRGILTHDTFLFCMTWQLLTVLTMMVVTTSVLFWRLSTISEYVSVKFLKKLMPVTSCQVPTWTLLYQGRQSPQLSVSTQYL